MGILYTHLPLFKWWRSRKALQGYTPEADVMSVGVDAEVKVVA